MLIRKIKCSATLNIQFYKETGDLYRYSGIAEGGGKGQKAGTKKEKL